MTTLEQEVIEKFRKLDKAAQARVRAVITQAAEEDAEEVWTPADPATFDYEAWFAQGEAIRERIKARPGGVFPEIDAIGILREIRDGEDDE
jgi:hypothetical protein